ncbi:Zn-dependent hydrolase [Halobacteriales archaeon SW_7_71_33]|nr:MAG: Zn-dependent hydrolase [Halobacteriales archaeon SW_7_71_33]
MDDPERSVDADRLWRDVERTGEFGATVSEPERRGRTAPTGSEANGAARDYLRDRMSEAGLSVDVDAVGNVRGRWVPDGADPERAAVAAGSHLDSVPEGGIFDGPLGVYAALEAVRAMQDAGVRPGRPVEVVSFTGEEGSRFGGGLVGSSVATGKRGVEEALALTDDEGVTLADALDGVGYRGEGRLDATAWDAWLELHVEQHTRLKEAGAGVGVVTEVTGITHVHATVEGAVDHAGSTPMADRTDALAAAADVIGAVEDGARDLADENGTAVGTVGSLSVEPDATNVVPGRVDLGVDLRDVERGSVDRMLVALEEALSRVETERGVETSTERSIDLDPTPTSERVRAALREAAEAADVEALDTHSGAAHDTMHVADVTDAGLLFAPSRDGVSHSPREWTSKTDCAAATRVLTGALWRLTAD